MHFLESRKDLRKCNQSLIKWSARQTELRRITVTTIHLHGPDQPVERLHLLLNILFLLTTGEEIHQPEVTIDKQLIILPDVFSFYFFIIPDIRISEGIDIKGNIALVTEPDEIIKLLDCIQNTITHGTRPVKDEDKTMVLTIRKDCYLLEKIFIVLVSMQFGAIKNTSA
tara:strand:+ start:450 stop:956 length:507 start_codon:yes stop_codon:yes gene_type:complete